MMPKSDSPSSFCSDKTFFTVLLKEFPSLFVPDVAGVARLLFIVLELERRPILKLISIELKVLNSP